MFMIRYLLMVALICITADAAPFFDAIYDAIKGNKRRSYGYGNYDYGGYGNGYDSSNGYGYGNGGYGYRNGGYGSYGYQRPQTQAPRQGKSYKDICKVHFTASYNFPGANGIVCPY